MSDYTCPTGIQILGSFDPRYAEILTTDALSLLGDLTRRFGPRVRELLDTRLARQARLDAGEKLDFLPETEGIRTGDWHVAPVPADIQDRRVEITGPVERKMIINALNSGAKVFMADFEDSNTPTWQNQIEGQINLRDANLGTIRFEGGGKVYTLSEQHAVLFVRPRGWHLYERHVTVDGEPVPGGIFDFALYMFHSAQNRLDAGSAPYFYLPKLESHTEARLWNEVIVAVQEALGLARGTVKATVLIETLSAAFEMNEILFELRDHSAGLNCGRWDYIFSAIKKRRADAGAIMPDRALITMNDGFLRAYSLLLIQTCHRRGAHAMGGMAAQIPIKGDGAANDAAFAKVRADKEREARDGHDGTWVAHPALVPVAREIFDAHMPSANQISNLRADVQVTANDILAVPAGPRTWETLVHNLKVSVRYTESWLRGVGCVPLYNLMEDAATAEISRTQCWQWNRYNVQLADGRSVTPELIGAAMSLGMSQVATEVGDVSARSYVEAEQLVTDMVLSSTLTDFLTLPALERIERVNPVQTAPLQGTP